ncbi:MAG TPA: sugar phosphate isomerase/epimerase [Verrucomicrobiae bacterium]
MNTPFNRRRFCGLVGTASAFATAVNISSTENDNFKITKGRIRQSIMGWTFNPMPTRELAQLCKSIGLVAMEGVGAEHYPMIKELGFEISLVSSHGFARGPFNPANHDHVVEKLREGIDLAVKFGAKSVITFTGMREPGISDEQGAKNCIDAWKKILPYAEEKKITLCLEHLNSRDNTHPMKGHPAYFGDDVDFCVDLINRVSSPQFKLLFDIYHVQIMNGDVIRRLRKYKDVIAHYTPQASPAAASWTTRKRSIIPRSCVPSLRPATPASSPRSSFPPGRIALPPSAMPPAFATFNPPPNT